MRGRTADRHNLAGTAQTFALLQPVAAADTGVQAASGSSGGVSLERASLNCVLYYVPSVVHEPR